MSNILHLLEAYRKHPAVTQLIQDLQPGADPKQVQLSGLAGAQRIFILAAIARAKELSNRCHVIVAESKEEAAYIQNDLAGMLELAPGAPAVYFFPDSFKRPSFFDDLNPTQVLQRSETVNKITADTKTGGIVVTYPEALFEKVVSPLVLNENRITVKVGEKLDVDFMMDVLIEYGFERTDFVYEPGQFSIRGGIIDLFSYGNDLPYRIELFDDEVESVRTFDPLTQLSQQKISFVSIVPNLNTRFRQDQKVSLFRILPEQTVLWMHDFQFLLNRLQYCFEKAEIFASKLTALDSAELREIFRDRAFLYPSDIKEDIETHSVIYWKSK